MSLGSISHIPETELVYLLKIKDLNALEYLYEHYSKALYTIILRIVHKEEIAEEILQEAFLKIWNNFLLFDTNKGRLFTWLISIARNLAIDYKRSKTAANEAQNQELESNVILIDTRDHIFYNPDTIGLKELVQELKTEQQEIIELIYFQGFTHAEAAEKLNIPLGTVKTRLRMAIMILRNYFN